MAFSAVQYIMFVYSKLSIKKSVSFWFDNLFVNYNRSFYRVCAGVGTDNLGDPEMFIEANPIIRPVHIVPELFVVLFIAFAWGKDIRIEGLRGYHNFFVIDGFKFGVMLFIFIFFDAALVPVHELGESWSPIGLHLVNPFGVPLLNTIILLRSGVTVTWAHH
ncbi:cytochrome c oxidase, subunit III, partial [Ostertagia ostertagi]